MFMLAIRTDSPLDDGPSIADFLDTVAACVRMGHKQGAIGSTAHAETKDGTVFAQITYDLDANPDVMVADFRRPIKAPENSSIIVERSC